MRPGKQVNFGKQDYSKQFLNFIEYFDSLKNFRPFRQTKMNIAILYIYIYVCVYICTKISFFLSEILICFELIETKRKTDFLRKMHYSFAAER